MNVLEHGGRENDLLRDDLESLRDFAMEVGVATSNVARWLASDFSLLITGESDLLFIFSVEHLVVEAMLPLLLCSVNVPISFDLVSDFPEGAILDSSGNVLLDSVMSALPWGPVGVVLLWFSAGMQVILKSTI